MGIFSSIGRGIKSAAGQITGKTAARQARSAGRQQAGAIMAGQRAQQRQVAPALRELQTFSDLGAGYLEPYRKMGWRGAARVLEDEFEMPTAEEVEASPAVQFRMEQAQRALERGAAARGGLMGGGHQRQLARYMQGLASQEYGAEADRRFQAAQLAQQGRLGLAGMGMQAAGQTAGMRERLGVGRAGIRTGSGAAAAAALQSAGQARASGALAGAQARQQAMGNIMQGIGTAGGMALGGPIGGALANRWIGGGGMRGEMAGEEELPLYGYGYPGMMGGAYG